MIKTIIKYMKRTTLKDIAQAAGVGVATVDRVLNQRAPVSPATTKLILNAAEELNYHATGLMRRRLEVIVPKKRLGFILQKQGKWFYQAIKEEIERYSRKLQDIQAEIEIIFVEPLSPNDLAEAVSKLSKRVDVIGLVSIDHPIVNAAVQYSVQRGVPVLAMLSPLSEPSIVGYIGIDGRKAGRTAGWFMSKLLNGPDEVGILIGSHRYIGQEDKEVGFRSFIRENSSNIRLRESLVYLDDSAVAYEAVAEMLKSCPNLKGIYHCGGGVSGAINALREADRKVAYICHEDSPLALAALRDGTADLIIATPVEQLAQQVTHAMQEWVVGRYSSVQLRPLGFRIITPENI